jgi:transcriptional regulator with XRE-family HTH domain
MTDSLKKMMANLPSGRRRNVQKRAARLIAEEMSLRDLRETFAKTQEAIAETMQVGQEAVSRIESRQKDMRISTLRNYVAAIGAELQLVAKFPDGRTVSVIDFAPNKTRIGRPPRTSARAGRRPTP